MRHGCLVTNLKNTFDSLSDEFTTKVGKGDIVPGCRCNIFAIGYILTGSAFSISVSSFRKYLFLIKNQCLLNSMTCTRLTRLNCFKWIVLAHEYVHVHMGSDLSRPSLYTFQDLTPSCFIAHGSGNKATKT